MREIMFRGKRKDNDEWVVSNSILQDNDKVFLFIEGHWIEVIPETVGEYMGQKDKNDKKIFEGDLVNQRRPDFKGGFVTRTGLVRFVKSRFGIYERGAHWSIVVEQKNREVICNIHDIPDMLLEVEE